MRWWAAFALVGGGLLAGLFEPLTQGRDDSWAIVLCVAAATLGLGLGVGRWWALAGPAVLVGGAIVASGFDPLGTWLGLLAALPALVGVAAIGVGIARRSAHRGRMGALAAFLVAAVPLLWAGVATVQRATASELPTDVQAQLPVDRSLGNLCPGSETPRDVSAELRHETEVLLRELRARPGWLVTYTYHWAHDEPEQVRITVRELGQEKLRELEEGGASCAPDLHRRLRDAL